MKLLNIVKQYRAFIFMAMVLLGSCKKNDTTTSAATRSPVIYPSKIVYGNNILVNGTATPSVTLYTFTYNPSFTLLSISTRFSGSSADTLYNKIMLNTTGMLSQFSTPKNSNALNISYDASGNVSSVAQYYLSGGIITNDTRKFQYSGSQIIGSSKFIAGSATAAQTNVFTTDGDGNVVTSATISTSTVYTYSSLPNPFYQLQNNAVLAFFPDQLWAPAEVILFSKNLMKDYTPSGGQTTSFSYQFDKYNRVTLVTATTPIANSSVPLILTYTVSYTN